MLQIIKPHLLTGAILSAMASISMATEEAKFNLVEKDGAFEIRDYEPCILATVVVEGEFESAGNTAFGRLFRYISGKNLSKENIAMTAPVTQAASSQKIAMTAPVEQQKSEAGWEVSFVMPASFTMESLPFPIDPTISLRPVPARRMAAVTYSGGWNEAGYLKHKAQLRDWIQAKGLQIVGEPVWARYDPPFQLWFLRRNEVLIPIHSAPGEP